MGSASLSVGECNLRPRCCCRCVKWLIPPPWA